MNKPALITAGLFGACVMLMAVFHFLNWLTKRRLKRWSREDGEDEMSTHEDCIVRDVEPPPPYQAHEIEN